MAFFRQFPRTAYVIDGSLVNIPDLFRRVGTNDIFDNLTYMETYDVQDGQRPEHISYDVYDTVDYYWVILLCNQIIDPYHDWPKSNIDLNNFAKQRYGELNLQKIHHYVDGTNANIRVDYDQAKFNTGAIKAVSNIEHEEKVNEQKRRIKLPRQEFVGEIAGQFKRLIKGR